MKIGFSKIDMPQEIPDCIREFGFTKTAKLLGVSRQLVHNWVIGKYPVAVKHLTKLEYILSEHGLVIPEECKKTTKKMKKVLTKYNTLVYYYIKN
jgi:DNA-binding transcriptional regulator YdaS (Cro superfamily)